MLLPDERYLFGRVINTEARVMSMVDVILVYIYRARAETPKLPNRRELRSDRLLVPPMMTNRLGWSRGLFETICNLPIEPGDVLDQHCFLDAFTGGYFDEVSNQVSGPVEPVGDFGLHSFRTMDAAISDALGIELAPD